MKTFEQLKEFAAKDKGYESWEDCRNHLPKANLDEMLSMLAEVYRVASHVADKYRATDKQVLVQPGMGEPEGIITPIPTQLAFKAAVEEINSTDWDYWKYGDYRRYKQLKDVIILGMSLNNLSVSPIIRNEPEWLKFQPG